MGNQPDAHGAGDGQPLKTRHDNVGPDAPPTQRQPELLDPAAAAAMLAVSRATFFNLVRSGRLPKPVRLGPRLPRWPRIELLVWILAGCPRASEWEKRNRNTRI